MGVCQLAFRTGVLAVGAIAMTPLPALIVAGTLVAAAALVLGLAVVKLPVFARLRIAWREPGKNPETSDAGRGELLSIRKRPTK